MVEAGSCLNSLPDYSFVKVALSAPLAKLNISSAFIFVLLSSPASGKLLVLRSCTAAVLCCLTQTDLRDLFPALLKACLACVRVLRMLVAAFTSRNTTLTAEQ